MDGPQLQFLPEARDRGLQSVGESIYLGVSPDLYDGVSEADWIGMKHAAPKFFDSWIGQRIGLPQGFEKHYRNDVIPDMEKIRKDPEAREGFRKELRELLNDPGRVRNLYTEGGETFSGLLDKWASRGGTRIMDALSPGIAVHSATQHVDDQTGMFRRSARAGRGRRLEG